ncbi:MAG: hypothetical protein E7316_00785 [Clostridiales bacterium]|nr:hypothetical protein [Clostridiales bacterium]
MENKQTVSCRRKNVKWLLSCVAFLCVVALLVVSLGDVFMEKAGSGNVISIYDKDAKYDVVFVGTSHVVSGVYPMEMWESHGLASYNYAQVGQPFGITYHYAREAIEVARPKLIVCDLYYIYLRDRLQGSTSFKHQSLDNMRFFSLNRLKAIYETLPAGEWGNFIFPFFSFHSRWDALKQADFTTPNTVTKGAAQEFSMAEQSFEQFVPIDSADMKKPKAYAVEYIDRLMALCERTGTQLLFTVIPYYPVGEEQGRDLEDDQRYFNWVTDYVESKGYDCLNMLYCYDEMGFDPAQHMREWNHCNYWGGVVVSRYLAEYIQQHYDIPNRAGQEGYEQWDKDMKAYDAWRKKQLDAFEKNND